MPSKVLQPFQIDFLFCNPSKSILQPFQNDFCSWFESPPDDPVPAAVLGHLLAAGLENQLAEFYNPSTTIFLHNDFLVFVGRRIARAIAFLVGIVTG